MILQVLDPVTGEVRNLTVDSQGRLRVAGTGEGEGGASAEEIGSAVDDALRAAPLGVAGTLLERIAEAAEDTDPVPVFGTVAVSNQPSSPPSASAIGNDLRGGAKLPANILMGCGSAKRVAAGSSSASQALTASGIAGVSITAVGADIRYNINAAASSTTHYLPEGQSRDFRVGASTVIHAMRAGDTDGVLEITELVA